MLPWGATAVAALRLDKTGARSSRRAPLRELRRASSARRHCACDNTSLEGKVTGHVHRHGSVLETSSTSAMRRRHAARKFLEEKCKDDVPSGIDVKLTNTPDWNGSDTPLVAEYELRIPVGLRWPGKRVLLPVGIFSRNEKHAFEHAARVHPLHLEFPYQHADDVTIELPEGWQASSIPKPRNSDLKVAVYNMAAENPKGSLHLKRDLALSLHFREGGVLSDGPRLLPGCAHGR
jgi:hypothetical protein